MAESPAAPANTHGRAGRNLPAAIGIGVGFGAYLVLSLLYFKPAFVVLVAVALVLASVELHEALKKQGMTSAIIPIAVGSVAISFGSYFAGRHEPVIFSTTSVLLASLALTVLASLIWRMRKGVAGFVRDAAASLLIIAYVPLLGSFAALMLAEAQGGTRLVTFFLIAIPGVTSRECCSASIQWHPRSVPRSHGKALPGR
jgi:phosphatidate cytidylyltransferase